MSNPASEFMLGFSTALFLVAVTGCLTFIAVV